MNQSILFRGAFQKQLWVASEVAKFDLPCLEFSIQKILHMPFPRSAQDSANVPWTRERLFVLCAAQASECDTGIQPGTSVKTAVTISV